MLLLGVVLLIGAYVLLLFFLENLLAENLQSQLGLAEKPEVNLVGNPLNMLAGRFEGGRIAFSNPDLGGVRPDSVTVDLDPFDLDVLGSVTSGWIKSDGPLSGNLEMELPEEEIDRIATSRFWCWLRSFWHWTTVPVGRCVILTAESVLLTC